MWLGMVQVWYRLRYPVVIVDEPGSPCRGWLACARAALAGFRGSRKITRVGQMRKWIQSIPLDPGFCADSNGAIRLAIRRLQRPQSQVTGRLSGLQRSIARLRSPQALPSTPQIFHFFSQGIFRGHFFFQGTSPTHLFFPRAFF